MPSAMCEDIPKGAVVNVGCQIIIIASAQSSGVFVTPRVNRT